MIDHFSSCGWKVASVRSIKVHSKIECTALGLDRVFHVTVSRADFINLKVKQVIRQEAGRDNPFHPSSKVGSRSGQHEISASGHETRAAGECSTIRNTIV